MKQCPFCAEEIQDEAIKCKHCGEFLEATPKLPWYYKTSSLVIAFLCVGPIALPLLWMRPGISKRNKILFTILVLIITWGLGIAMTNAYKSFQNMYEMLVY